MRALPDSPAGSRVLIGKEEEKLEGKKRKKDIVKKLDRNSTERGRGKVAAAAIAQPPTHPPTIVMQVGATRRSPPLAKAGRANQEGAVDYDKGKEFSGNMALLAKINGHKYPKEN
jgi:hypothetical protein